MSNKSKINKQPTSAAEAKRAGVDPFDVTGNVRKKGQDPSPDDRERGERSDKERAQPLDTGR